MEGLSGVVAVGNLLPKLSDFFEPLLTFLACLLTLLARPSFNFIRPLNSISRPLFSRFSSSSFSRKHNVTPNASESSCYATVDKHLVQQVKVGVCAPT